MEIQFIISVTAEKTEGIHAVHLHTCLCFNAKTRASVSVTSVKTNQNRTKKKHFPIKVDMLA